LLRSPVKARRRASTSDLEIKIRIDASSHESARPDFLVAFIPFALASDPEQRPSQTTATSRAGPSGHKCKVYRTIKLADRYLRPADRIAQLFGEISIRQIVV
jgi:hypothetical protein